MSYQVKKTIVSVVTGALILAAYCIYAFGFAMPGLAAPDNLSSWATTILIFIGIGIGASIVIQIIFHILLSIATAIRTQITTGKCDDKDVEKTIKAEMVEDEMDKLIGLKSMRVSFAAAGIGFIAGLIFLALSFPASVMLNILFLCFSVGTIIEGITQLYFYRRGVKNG
jgi:hypothetical protein